LTIKISYHSYKLTMWSNSERRIRWNPSLCPHSGLFPLRLWYFFVSWTQFTFIYGTFWFSLHV